MDKSASQSPFRALDLLRESGWWKSVTSGRAERQAVCARSPRLNLGCARLRRDPQCRLGDLNKPSPHDPSSTWQILPQLCNVSFPFSPLPMTRLL